MKLAKTKENTSIEAVYNFIEGLELENHKIIGINFFDYVINEDETKTIFKLPEFCILLEDEDLRKSAIKISTLNDFGFIEHLEFREIENLDFHESLIQFKPSLIDSISLSDVITIETESRILSIKYDQNSEDEIIELEIIKKPKPIFLKIKDFLISFMDYELHTVYISKIWKPYDSKNILSNTFSFELRNESKVLYVNMYYEESNVQFHVSDKLTLENANIFSIVPTKTNEIEFTKKWIKLNTAFNHIQIEKSLLYDNYLEIALSVE